MEAVATGARPTPGRRRRPRNDALPAQTQQCFYEKLNLITTDTYTTI